MAVEHLSESEVLGVAVESGLAKAVAKIGVVNEGREGFNQRGDASRLCGEASNAGEVDEVDARGKIGGNERFGEGRGLDKRNAKCLTFVDGW